MEEKILGEFKIIYFGKLFIYADRIEIRLIIRQNIIPASKIANISYNRLINKFIIETTGGGKVDFYLWGGPKVGTEALRLMNSLHQ